ncbi:hypothetical protein BGX26_002233 [Mortierella sp. AD094]|nr:hypothetical protein BGX26_002233 [Mortierella sp. AD094]
MYALRNISRLSNSAAAIKTSPKAFNAAFLRCKKTLTNPSSNKASMDVKPSTMSNPPGFKLFCLVDEQSTSNAFKVNIQQTADISDLRDAIKAEEIPELVGIHVAKLNLWKVSVPDDATTIVLSDVGIEAKQELNRPGVPISKEFPVEPDDNTYIVVQLPQQITDLRRKTSDELIRSKRRCFAVGYEAYPTHSFFIDPDVEAFGEYLLQRKFCLFLGHRQSGKTTTSHALLRWLKEHPEKFTELTGRDQDNFAIYFVTFDSTVKTDKGSGEFWRTVCKILRQIDRERFQFDDTASIDGNTFKGFFSKGNRSSTKRAILIIDEASRLTSVGGALSEAAKEITGEFIDVLRSLRNEHNYILHAVALVGTESVKELLAVRITPGKSSQISPFTASAIFNAGRFTKAEVKELYDQFGTSVSKDFESADISSDIFDLALGHKGLVGSCGTFIQDTYFRGQDPIITVDGWKANHQ